MTGAELLDADLSDVLVAIRASDDGRTWAVVAGGGRVIGTCDSAVAAGELVQRTVRLLGPLGEALMLRRAVRPHITAV